MGIFLSMSAEEIATMRRRIIRRMDAMVTREGKVPFHAPYGYKNIGGGLVEVVENEAKVVKKIFKLRADGASYQMIADILNNEGISTRRKNGENSSGKWTKSITEYVIKNEFYLGVVKFMGKVGQGFFDTFISRDIFEKANHGSSQKVARKPLEFPLK